MEKLTFDDLLVLYRKIAFEGDREGRITIDDQLTLDVLKRVDSDPASSGMHALTDLDQASVGDMVRLEVTQPKIALGAFAETFDDLLQYPQARFREYSHYYVVDGSLTKHSLPQDDLQIRYRLCLKLLSLLREAASYFDENREELIFIAHAKVIVPITYDVSTLKQMDVKQIATLIDLFQGDVHQEQKLSLLAESIIRLSVAHPLALRFRHLLLNVELVVEDVRQGYRLFASSFSYSKIRSEIESARVEYLGKIHKTIVDIQNQLLGIPVATIIVASQLKEVSTCGPGVYTNLAVVAGAWIFTLLLLIAVVNQWLTLAGLRAEIGNQRKKLKRDYAALGDQFVSSFDGLNGRITWHQAGLTVVVVIALLGAGLATLTFQNVTTPTVRSCLN